MEKCITCGFLCKYVPGDDVPMPKFFEMEKEEREKSLAFRPTITYRGDVASVPACFRGVDDVQSNFASITSRSPSDKFYEIINRNRQCKKWKQYDPGFSPIDHLQEWRMNELELKRQEFEKNMAQNHTNVLLK